MFDLIKFTEEQYVESLLDGHLYMNSIGYFWKSGFEGQKDFAEGTVQFVQPQSILPNEISQYTLGNVGLLNDNYKYVNVFCMYRLDRYMNQILEINKKVLNFGLRAIHITNADAFIQRVIKAMQNHTETAYCCGDVNYYNYFGAENLKYNFGCFCKSSGFSYQKEWRICLLKNYQNIKKNSTERVNQEYLEPFVLDIGSIRDIAKDIPSSTIINNPTQYFNGAKIVKSISRKNELTPLIADKWFEKGIIFPRNALDGAYWGNDKDEFNEKVLGLTSVQYVKPYFTIG